jgi:hypothetical protein
VKVTGHATWPPPVDAAATYHNGHMSASLAAAHKRCNSASFSPQPSDHQRPLPSTTKQRQVSLSNRTANKPCLNSLILVGAQGTVPLPQFTYLSSARKQTHHNCLSTHTPAHTTVGTCAPHEKRLISSFEPSNHAWSGCIRVILRVACLQSALQCLGRRLPGNVTRSVAVQVSCRMHESTPRGMEGLRPSSCPL